MSLSNEWISEFIFNSNGIEGYYTPAKDILKILGGKVPGKSPLIINQIEAVKYVELHKNGIPTLGQILDLHRILLNGMDTWAGKLRQFPVYIGGDEAPNYTSIFYLLSTWINTWERKPVKSWTQKKTAFLRHCEYEYIHPFSDGNGRSGRLLLLWDCLHHGTTMDIIECDNPKRFAYYDKLQEYRRTLRDKYLKEWR